MKKDRNRLLTPGPTPLPERVSLAMAQSIMHHRKQEFCEIFAQTQKGLQKVFGTEETVLTLSSSGTGAMTAAASNLFSAGEKVLVASAGYFGERWEKICRQLGFDVVSLPLPWGTSISANMIYEALNKDSGIQGLFIQHSETSTGVMHPIEEIAAVCKKFNVFLVVDGISSVSIAPCPMDAWGIDCLLTGSQKGLLLPPGLAFLAFSERAWLKSERIKKTHLYFDLYAEYLAQKNQKTSFTPAISLILGLQEALRMFDEIGLDTIYKKQRALTNMVRAGIHAMGLELFVKEHYTWGLTSILLPPKCKASALAQHASEHYSCVFATGQGAFDEHIIRFGHMGWVDYGDVFAGLFALAESYKALGGSVNSHDYLNQAANAYNKSYEEEL